METEVKGCPRNCRRCNMAQQMFCAAQMSLSTMDMVLTLSDKMDSIVQRVNSFMDSSSLIEPKAQEGAAVQKIDSPSLIRQKDNE